MARETAQLPAATNMKPAVMKIPDPTTVPITKEVAPTANNQYQKVKTTIFYWLPSPSLGTISVVV